jgi:2-polyprenyl-6-methoxyphenol hydroxylase-like FAD-dependent oxidoreductase
VTNPNKEKSDMCSTLSAPATLVVGAGPVGLAAALELDRSGFAVRIIDKAADRTNLSKAVGINARTLKLLEGVGVTPRLVAAGLKIERINLRDGEQILTRVDFSKLPGPYNFMLSLPQSETERILADALAERGITVERQCELIGLDQDTAGISAQTTTAGAVSNWQGDYLLGCDGAHSTVRKTLGLDFAGEAYPETWSLADVRMDWPLGHTEGNLFMGADGRVLFVMPMPEGRHRVIANAPDVLTLLPAGSLVREILWQTDFTVSLRQVASYGRGRVYLAGDAAHIHFPAGGRGMNLGIADACDFAKRAAEGRLEGYSTERHKAGRQVVRESDMQFRMARIANPILRGARNLFVRHVLGSELIQSKFRLRMAGLEAG